MAKYQKKEDYTDYQVYELWWKFLSLSNSYREFCEIMRSVTDTETEDFYKHVEAGYKKRHPESESLFEYEYYRDHLANWEFMGDVHLNSFDEWWKKWEIPKQRSYSVINLRDQDIRKKLPRYQFGLHLHKRKYEKPPTPDEVTKYLTGAPEYIFVAIPVSPKLKTEEIRKVISDLRKKGSRRYMNIKINECRHRVPYGVIKLSELKRYYDVYKTRMIDQLSRKDAQQKTGVYDSSQFSKDLNKAIAIIKNVEEGFFPGEKYWGKSFLEND